MLNFSDPFGLSPCKDAQGKDIPCPDKKKVVEWMRQNASAGPYGKGKCATYCRQGLEAGGFGKSDDARPLYAGDYGPFLTKRGAEQVAEGTEMATGKDYVPQEGDIAVFARTDAHDAGHIQIYDGTQWISDFKQTRFSPYHESEPYKIYRFPDN